MIHTNFELGLLNAYLFVVVYLILTILPFLFKKDKKSEEKSHKKTKNGFFYRFIYNMSSIMFILAIAVSFFLPLVFDSVFFVIGIGLWAIGIIIVSSVCITWIKTPSDKLLTEGMYKYSRNPMYLSFFFAYTGIGLISKSWIFLTITFVYMIVVVLFVKEEEKICLEKYGEEYKEYMNKTPRWIVFKK